MAGDADFLGIDGLVGLKVIERPARAPSPGSKRTPVVRLAKLTLVTKSDDAFLQARSVIGLHRRGNQLGITPALGQ